MAIVLNAILPAPDPSTGLRAGAWFGPLVLATALAILLGLMLGYLYVHLVCKESVPALVRRQVRKAIRPIVAAIDRTEISGLLEPIRARAVVIALAALLLLLGLVLLWIGLTVVKAVPWWAAALIIVIAFIGIVRKRKGPGAQ